jgi:hypothetical protein
MNVRPAAIAAGGVRVSTRAGRAGVAVGGALALTGLFVLRLRGMHEAPLYPDGYQYLTMARGIGQHLQPVAALGPGGDLLAPSADAAAKPLFPALVALAESVGLSPLEAAQVVAALAAAAVAPLAGLVTLRLGANRAAALLAALLCLASPALGFWSGFAGPDVLAQALALAAALAFLCRRPVTGGLLAGLCVAARPELAALWFGAALAAAAAPRLRRDAVLGSAAALTVLAGVIGLLRPPLASSTLLLLAAGAALGCLVGAALVLAGRSSVRACGGSAAGLGLLLAFAIVRGSGWSDLARHDWALLTLAGAGLLVAGRSPSSRAAALRIAALTLALGVVYWWKNPGSERYVAVLLPALAVLAGLGLSRLRPGVLAGAAALALAGTLAASMPDVGPDSFSAIAGRLEHAPAGTLVTAAPDAYGVLLPGRAVRVMRPGAAGLVLVDGAARAYEPGLRVSGRLVARIAAGPGFLRPDGRLDDAPALLYRGRVLAPR